MVREPILKPVPLNELHPTQITVGMREVAAKRRRWRARHGEKAGGFLGEHMVPVVLGPQNQHYVIDRHHLARALLDEGVKHVLATTVSDLSRLDRDAFWVVLDNRGWLHPFDDKGRRCGYDHIPEAIKDLVDDPFRSLAGELRSAGGFAKDSTPFSEFLWADFLRRRMTREAVTASFEHALEKALRLAKSPEADYLPGWCGPVDD